LRNDPKTLACEIPVWATSDEDPILKELIPIENTDPFPTLTGHIDLIRFSEQLLWIWAAHELRSTVSDAVISITGWKPPLILVNWSIVRCLLQTHDTECHPAKEQFQPGKMDG
jgi:hypothetical protein